MQREWIAGRYNITEKAHCIVFVRQQFVNPAYAVTAERQRDRESTRQRGVYKFRSNAKNREKSKQYKERKQLERDRK